MSPWVLFAQDKSGFGTQTISCKLRPKLWRAKNEFKNCAENVESLLAPRILLHKNNWTITEQSTIGENNFPTNLDTNEFQKINYYDKCWVISVVVESLPTCTYSVYLPVHT
jgi:hypothetical protein